MQKPTVRHSLAALAVLLGTASVAQAATLTRQPYLQSTTATSTLVAFRTDASCDSVVRYGPTGTEQSSEAPAGTQHLHELKDLTPGAEYQYQVEACGTVLSTGKHFRTATPVGTRSVHFAAVGDQGKGNTAQREVSESILAARPELALALGDNAYESGTEAEHQQNLFNPMAGMLAEVPFFPSPGNHEYKTSNAAPYLSNFHLPTNNPAGTERYYSFDWGQAHFVSIDSMCARGTSSNDCTASAQREWLEQDLANSNQPFKVVYFHHPPYSSGDHLSDSTMQSTWAPIFEKHGVDLVLSGHDHNYERSYPLRAGQPVAEGGAGTTYIVAGSGGASLRAWPISQPSWSAIRNNTDYGYLDVKIEGGTLTGRFLTPSGKEADRFTIVKALPEPAAPTVHATAEVGNGPAPLDALLVATATPEDAEISWDFGDGSGGEGPQVAHTYGQPGQYTATATARDPRSGATATSTVTVYALTADGSAPPPVAGESPESGTPDGLGPADGEGAQGCGAGGVLIAPLTILGALSVFIRRRRRS